MTHLLAQADAARMPLADASVDLIVCSPPYFALRSYRDNGEHYDGQIGSEPTPQAFLEALWAVMAECWRVLKPTGSCFVNLGDKRAGSGGHNNSNLAGTSRNAAKRWCSTCERHVSRTACQRCGDTNLAIPSDIVPTTRRNAPDRYNQAAFGRTKSKLLLPHRFAIGCEDGLADPEGRGWIVRSDLVWSKLNGLPESVTDRCRDSHEYLFHLTKEGRYFSAVDEVREAQSEPERSNGKMENRGTKNRDSGDPGVNKALQGLTPREYNPLGKLPGSVWPLASEPLIIPEAVKAHYDLPDHFAAFPTELVRRVVLGWSPSGVCVACGEGRRPVVEKEYRALSPIAATDKAHDPAQGNNFATRALGRAESQATITGYACACPDDSAPTRPAVVLDPFSGTATTVGTARALGRIGVGLDLSMDYCRLGRYFVTRSTRFAKVAQRTHKENQAEMFAAI